jgi:magnesium transporter
MKFLCMMSKCVMRRTATVDVNVSTQQAEGTQQWRVCILLSIVEVCTVPCTPRSLDTPMALRLAAWRGGGIHLVGNKRVTSLRPNSTLPRQLYWRSSSSFTSNNNGIKPPTQNLPLATTYKVAQVTYNGTITMRSLQTSEILRESSIYARDLFSLSLTSKHERAIKRGSHGAAAHHTTRPLSVILPRGKEILLSFGNIRALIERDHVLMFDAHDLSVRQFANEVALAFRQHLKEIEASKARGEVPPRDLNYFAEPFELVFIEEVLRETCDAFSRRIRLYEPIVDSFVDRVANEVFSDSGVHQLVPIKDSLQSFEIHVKQSIDCLTTLLSNDQDMILLLLTEQAKAEAKGEKLSHERHEDVELLLEEYARQLNNILFEINYLLQRLDSKREFVSLALAGYRNRLLRMHLYLGIVGVSLGIGTTIAGFFGMNLISGLEHSPYAFNNVVLLTGVTSVSVAVACAGYVSGKTMQRRAKQRLDEIEALTGALSDMSALDFTVKTMLEKNAPMSKEEFRMRLKQARLSRKVTEKEVDLLFDTMDMRKDGFLFKDDFKGMKRLTDKQRWNRTSFDAP